jgi:NAD+ diphosphatase
VVCAVALEQWHQRHPRCPRCGAETVETQAGWTRRCVADGSEHFPRTDPAVIMLVHDGADRALLGRGKQWGEGRFSTLAGFVEPGESIEAAVAREVFEEVGVTVRDVRYVASQPWPFPASLMLGFMARLDGSPDIALDPVEMAEAAWFTRDEVRQARDWTDGEEPAIEGTRLHAIPPHLSISRYLIDAWLAGER